MLGNRTVQTRTITSTQVTTYTYDAANRLATQNGQSIFAWDANGNLLQDGSTVYAYDFANRLISTTLSGATTQFAYNGDGIRLRLIEAGTLTTYTQDYAAPLPVVLQAKTGSASTQYVYSLGTRPVAEYETAAWEYLLADALGSVRQIADSGGNVTLLKSYEPYGSVLNSQGNATSIFAYAGEQIDNTGLVYLRARYMQPRLGVFLSRDPWLGYEQMPGTYNGFNYASGNPVNLTDPAGLQALNLGWAYFARCFGIHTGNVVFGIGGDTITAEQAVNVCKEAYSKANWYKGAPIVGFELGQELPTRAHDLFGWFVHDWRGRFNSDRLFFDANQPLTKEVQRTLEIGRLRREYYDRLYSTDSGPIDIESPTEFQFDDWQQILSWVDMIKNVGQGTVSISWFMGSFYYQIRTLPQEGEVGFRIDNQTGQASGSHIADRYSDEGYSGSVEELIRDYDFLRNRPVEEIIKQYPVISILRDRTRAETGGRGGGNLYETFTWTEKLDCSFAYWAPWDRNAPYFWGNVDIEVWDDFRSWTVDPPGWPAQ